MAKFNFSKWGNDLYTGRVNYDVVGKRKYFFAASAGVLVICIALLFAPGLSMGIDFRGGSEFRVVTAEQSVDIDRAEAAIATITDQEPHITKVGTGSLRIQTQELSNDQTEELRVALAEQYSVPVEDVTSTFIGPSWGADVSSKAIRGAVIFLILVLIAMTLYFRAWRMAISAVVALGHDLLVTLGVYAIVQFEVTPATVIGVLTVLAYSLYDTVVIFDKVRENTSGVLDQSGHTYAEAANLAVNQTMVRSINTSIVALLPVGSILFIGAFLLGAGTLRDISLALFVGMAAGTYSSIFLATPLEVALRQNETKIKAHTARVAKARAEGGEAVVSTRLTPIGALKPGQHQGQSAQPRRRRREER